MQQTVGVIGSGSFGITIAKLLSENTNVLVFSRKQETIEQINQQHHLRGVDLPSCIVATDDLQMITERCSLIFPVVPSASFRQMMKTLAPFLRPNHLLIHGTKGFDIRDKTMNDVLTRNDVFTMSDVILQESIVVRVGCLSGPNLSKEILQGQPAATLIASPYSEVIKQGQQVLRSKRFQVYGSSEMIAAELAGVLKNTIAIGAGVLGGLGLGQNIWALLISRGLVEMIYIAKAFGYNSKAFLGVAGIGDLVATASSVNSRNYSLGMRKAKGETLEQINKSMTEVAEGVRTLQIVKRLCEYHKIHAPITLMLYKIVFENHDVEKALEYLMNYPYEIDVDFI